MSNGSHELRIVTAVFPTLFGDASMREHISRYELWSCKSPPFPAGGGGLKGNPFCKRAHAAVAKGTLALSKEAVNGRVSRSRAPESPDLHAKAGEMAARAW